MGKIVLEGLEFFGFHGFHEEEKKIGNRYSVDIIVSADFEEASYNDDLAGTVDYTELYQIIRVEMQQSSNLLEHIAQRIISKIFDDFSQVKAAEVRISKYNPPIGGICKRACVEVSKVRTV